MSRALLCSMVLLAACKDSGAVRTPPTTTAKCGDGTIQEGEQCDGSADDGQTCQSRGFDEGTLQCSSTCQFDTSLCSKRCGNGVIDSGEQCDGTLGVPVCTTWGTNVCTDECTLDTRFCVGTPYFTAAPELSLDKGGPSILVDGQLAMVVPAFERVELTTWQMTRGFEAGASRKLSFFRTPRRVESFATTDLLTINEDGSIDRLHDEGGSFSLQTLGTACAGATFVPHHGASPTTALLKGCGGYVQINSAVTTTAAANLRAITRLGDNVYWADTDTLHTPSGDSPLNVSLSEIGFGDLDGDGDVDLAGITATDVTVFENTGGGYAPAQHFTGTAQRELHVLDIDGDGRIDLLWLEGDTLVIRRAGSESRVDLGAGARLSFAIGDADGDGDLDVSTTISTGTDSTTTRTFLNRSR